MTHQQTVEAYNLGWNRARHPQDHHFHVDPPSNRILADEYHQGWDDGRRSRLAAQPIERA